MSNVKDVTRDGPGETGSTAAAGSVGIDIGRPVAWMVDPDQPDIILGVTYAFSLSGERRTVWYTPNEREAEKFRVATEIVAT